MGVLVSLAVAAVMLAISLSRASNQERQQFRAVTACAAVVIAAGLSYRIWRIRRVFAAGAVVIGRVLEIDVNADNVHSAIAAYEFEGQRYQVKNTTEATGQMFSEGDAVELVVDPAKPSRAYIVKLFA